MFQAKKIRKYMFWAPGILGVGNILLAANPWMLIGGILLLVMQIWDIYDEKM